MYSNHHKHEVHYFLFYFGVVEQLVAHKAHNLEDVGSSPTCAITKSYSTYDRFFIHKGEKT